MRIRSSCIPRNDCLQLQESTKSVRSKGLHVSTQPMECRRKSSEYSGKDSVCQLCFLETTLLSWGKLPLLGQSSHWVPSQHQYRHHRLGIINMLDVLSCFSGTQRFKSRQVCPGAVKEGHFHARAFSLADRWRVIYTFIWHFPLYAHLCVSVPTSKGHWFHWTRAFPTEFILI